MTLQELLEDIPVCDVFADREMEITDICYDLGTITPGCLFAQIEHYVPQEISLVKQRGAAVLLCKSPPEEAIPYILTKNVRRSYAQLCCRFFGNPADKMQLIGITGTNGKSTTVMLVKQILEHAFGENVGLIGTITNMIGSTELPSHCTTPDSYELQKLISQMAQAGCRYVVMEVSSHALSQYRTAGLSFAVAGFSNLTQDHLDYHKTMFDYAKAKAQLFTNCEYSVINADDEWCDFMKAATQKTVVTISSCGKKADLTAENIQLGLSGTTFLISCGGRQIPIFMPLLARYNVSNALLAIGICHVLGVPVMQSAEILKTVQPIKGRMEILHADANGLILIDYAHTPDAMKQLLCSVREVGAKRVIIVFGCGGNRDRSKRPLMGHIAVDLADFVVLTSDNPRLEEPEQIIDEIVAGIPEGYTNYVVQPDRTQAIRYALGHRQPGDVVILAGKGHEMTQTIGTKQLIYDERKIVDKLLNEVI